MQEYLGVSDLNDDSASDPENSAGGSGVSSDSSADSNIGTGDALTGTTTNDAAGTAPLSTMPVDELTLTQVDTGDSQTTDVGDGGDIAEVDGPTVSRRVDGSGLVIAFKSNTW